MLMTKLEFHYIESIPYDPYFTPILYVKGYVDKELFLEQLLEHPEYLEFKSWYRDGEVPRITTEYINYGYAGGNSYGENNPYVLWSKEKEDWMPVTYYNCWEHD